MRPSELLNKNIMKEIYFSEEIEITNIVSVRLFSVRPSFPLSQGSDCVLLGLHFSLEHAQGAERAAAGLKGDAAAAAGGVAAGPHGSLDAVHLLGMLHQSHQVARPDLISAKARGEG